MDVILRTNDAACELALYEVAPAPDHPSFRTRLVVRAGGFSADIHFWIERHCMEQFLNELRAMDQTLHGEALLQPEHELDHVSLAVTRTGAVVVSGELGSKDFTYLKFQFTTDQTCLRPLIADLEEVLLAPAG